jgi:uncharacterized protein
MNHEYPDARLLIFSKAPQAGQVKTRLIPLLGSDGATALYRQLLEHTIAGLSASGLCPVELYCDPDPHQDYFRDCRERYRLSLHRQSGRNLGERMSQALFESLQRASRAVLVGADCPTLAADDVAAALEALGSGYDVVFGPALDGGYYLVGLHIHQAGIFTDIPWGSNHVLAQTLQRVEQLGLRYHLLPARADLDTPEDYLAWCAAGQDRGT